MTGNCASVYIDATEAHWRPNRRAWAKVSPVCADDSQNYFAFNLIPPIMLNYWWMWCLDMWREVCGRYAQLAEKQEVMLFTPKDQVLTPVELSS